MVLIVRRLPGFLYGHRYVCASLFVVIGTILYLLLRWGVLCSNLETWHHVNRACQFYDHGVAVGTLCRPLCITRDIHSLNCHSFRSIKEAVFSGTWHQTRFVFKAASPVSRNLHWYDNGVKKYPTEKEFLSTVRGIVFNKLNLSLARDSLVSLSRLRPAYEERDVAKRHLEMDNLWPLLQDNEYLITALFTGKDVFPRLLGTCGLYFAVEYVEPIRGSSTLLAVSDSKDEWGKKLKIAVMMLELLDELETSFQEPFHLCDIKLNHFGLTRDESKLKFIDLRSVYPKSVINTIIRSGNQCKSDSDCDFYDCRAHCIRETRRCSGVTNNNVQIVCEKIFLGWTMSTTVIVPGLLMSEHTPSSLAAVLRQCANPHSEPTLPRGAASDDIKKRLYNMVVEMDHSINNEFYLK